MAHIRLIQWGWKNPISPVITPVSEPLATRWILTAAWHAITTNIVVVAEENLAITVTVVMHPMPLTLDGIRTTDTIVFDNFKSQVILYGLADKLNVSYSELLDGIVIRNQQCLFV